MVTNVAIVGFLFNNILILSIENFVILYTVLFIKFKLYVLIMQ